MLDLSLEDWIRVRHFFDTLAVVNTEGPYVATLLGYTATSSSSSFHFYSTPPTRPPSLPSLATRFSSPFIDGASSGSDLWNPEDYLLSRWSRDVIIAPDNDSLLLECHQQIVNISNDWHTDWINLGKYDHTFEDCIALVITHINEQLRSLGYPDTIWFDFNAQLRDNHITRSIISLTD